ncbi:ABC transporter ATP-binding protein [Chelatococcus asaccharovorans]|uniref:Amino acid/amide ABC transporter ATP-binding protein 2 (HAAT family) n=1 Tax=Chelatococcus asaccharovorans TaxID=28210 RepID=A0A2V3UI42_9HYPH|nr:ABC transporter ATP-binding protein [Chelatococcus asaccharovorans]MBS7701871.1 ABC transporter ATP-binding protein [Chelatococcus asaccharovorans]PXW64420.1 amino acid/amide ABC transporter ATP-binding protein 2 (HAAT family) [Chelatococcus asaccharovorans]CAH1666053.1 branched chain amino acid/phenylalanine ABC transporter ATP binding subunit LivF [Chelatococcus asaccharovorans]CAH1681654.1 branched chain amino acid/phenylalanine ABC transporter ATP binding subunit LivF [Chelatococcus asac
MLTVEALSSAYGRIMALREVSLEVKAGEIVALVGSNGAGKTTLLRAISGVQPVCGGRILFEGEAIERLEPHLRVMRGISQSPEGRQVFGPLNVEDNLKLGAYRRQDARRQARLDHVYGLFPVLAERRKTPAMSLSGGQQQMLAIGRALMAGPKLLLLDEPSLGLAPLLVDQILAAVTSLRTEGITTLLVEQNASAALAIADRGYVLETGHIAMEGSGAALLEDPMVRAAYLGL